jgi:small subunit ribosomal protein S16
VAVTLRLTRRGQKKRPFYRIIAADTAARRDGRFLEIVGTYNPLTQPATITLKEDRVRYWVGVGAQQSRLVGDLIKKEIPGLLEERTTAKQAKVQAKRKKRKAALKSKSA